ncbi:putative linoleate 9S-lipoxygenase 5 [Silene latifolia]|uniref:putative linoleate 9S-lipoxygenase 5 n=1 Tax=Silene latifolia TaxID=37657 RepID=UPI003D77362E
MMNLLLNKTTIVVNHTFLSIYPRTKIIPATKLHLNMSSDIKGKTKHTSLNVFNKSTHVKEKEDFADVNKVVVKGIVVLKKKSLLGLKDVSDSSVLDTVEAEKVSLQLVSAVNADPANNLKGKVGIPACLEELPAIPTGLADDESAFTVAFDWNEEIALPGALIVKNEHHNEFYLKTVTLQDVPGSGIIHFDCNSWVYPVNFYLQKYRIFFTNKTYLPHQTPKPITKYREEELQILRGKGRENAKLQEWDRVYDYAFYNDLGEPDKGPDHVRPIFGGSAKYPYPRRTRTSRPPTDEDPHTESRLPLLEALPRMYVPRDEKFGHSKLVDFLGDTGRSVSHGVVGLLKAVFDTTPTEFDSLQDVLNLYEKGIKLHNGSLRNKLKKLLHIGDSNTLKFPMPDIIKEDKTAWRTDEEFARQMLAGLHPLLIRRLEEFPPVSKLDKTAYGNQTSSITKECIEKNLDGLNVDEAIKSSRLFILDHHDKIMPYLRQINTNTTSKVYATRTILFLKEDGTLKPLVIELSLPHTEGDQYGAISEVHTPAYDGIKGSLWQLAKTYVAVTDSGYHQLISHWLNTHAVMEPFVIATNRQLSVLHPIYKLLQPHFRYTISINAVARQIALNANGLFEAAVFPRKYVGEWTSEMYKDWVFTEQALPKDLVKRGMAVKDSKSRLGYKLLIEDYPYAVDGLEIWSGIETWVKEFCSIYYNSDQMVANDTELQAWWKEIREKGHGDKKDEKWWPEMKTLDELIESCTTIIWVASALHSVVNFGQYPYGGYMPNRPTISRRFMPKPDTPEYKELKTNPDLAFLKTVPNQLQTLLAMSVIELISGHSPDEVYLGQQDPRNSTYDAAGLEAFRRFTMNLSETEARIIERNNDTKLKNRVGSAKLPYTLLCPSSGEGITGKGIPNSISI